MSHSSSKQVKLLLLASTLLATATAHSTSTSHQHLQQQANPNCAEASVNFWKRFAIRHRDVSALPSFLIQENCISSSTTNNIEFYNAMQKRLDNPEEAAWQEQLASVWQSSKSRFE